jgi:hypothetical protein
MRVFLWVVAPSWATMMASEDVMLWQLHNHRVVELATARGRRCVSMSESARCGGEFRSAMGEDYGTMEQPAANAGQRRRSIRSGAYREAESQR